jgi:hypothetical protein
MDDYLPNPARIPDLVAMLNRWKPSDARHTMGAAFLAVSNLVSGPIGAMRRQTVNDMRAQAPSSSRRTGWGWRRQESAGPPCRVSNP